MIGLPPAVLAIAALCGILMWSVPPTVHAVEHAGKATGHAIVHVLKKVVGK